MSMCKTLIQMEVHRHKLKCTHWTDWRWNLCWCHKSKWKWIAPSMSSHPLHIYMQIQKGQDVNLFLLFGGLQRGITSSEIGENGPIFLQNILRMIHVCRKQQPFLGSLAEALIKDFLSTILCKVLWLIKWNNTYFASWWSVISPTKLQ